MATTTKDKESENELFGCLGKTVLVLGLLVLSSLLRGWTLSILWAWFIMPKFAAPALSIAYAIGISLTANFVVQRLDENTKPKTTEEQIVLYLQAFIIPMFALGFGWIVHQFAH